MPVDVVIPMLGLTTERGTIIRWRKREGEKVQKGEILFEVETEKVVTEVESPATGILARILVPEGVEVPVLTVVGVIVQEGEVLPESLREAAVRSTERPYVAQGAQHTGGKSSLGKSKIDLAIVGGGPAGYVAAIRAAQRGARVLLIEKERVGGTCLHKGCIPTKCFLWDVELLQKVKRSDVFSEKSSLALDVSKMVARKERVISGLLGGLKRTLSELGVELITGVGELLDANSIVVKQDGDQSVHEVRNVLIATGSAPAPLGDTAVDGQFVLYSDHLMEMSEVPGRMAVIGGGAIGLEWATIMRGLGTEVVVLEILPRLLANADQEIGKILQNALDHQHIRIITGAFVREIRRKGQEVEVVYQTEGQTSALIVDKVLLAAGRTPNTQGLGLEKIGLQKNGPFVQVDETMRTNVSSIYAAGDVTGGPMLAHAAFWEADVAVRNMLGERVLMNYQRVPRCIYTSPEVAWIGVGEEEATRSGYEVQVAKFPFRYSGKALATESGEGLLKIVAEKEVGQILGVFIVGPQATELIGECLLAMRLEASVEELADVIKPHPSLSEAVTEAALGWIGRPIHLSGGTTA